MSVNVSKAWQHQCEKHKVFLSSLNWCCSKFNREREDDSAQVQSHFSLDSIRFSFLAVINLDFFKRYLSSTMNPLSANEHDQIFHFHILNQKVLQTVQLRLQKREEMIWSELFTFIFPIKSSSDISLTIERGDNRQERNQIFLLLHFSLCTAEVFPSSQK